MKLRLKDANNPLDQGKIYEAHAQTVINLPQTNWGTSTNFALTNMPNDISSTQSAVFSLNLIDENIASGAYNIELASWHRVEFTTESNTDTVHVKAGPTASTPQLNTMIVELYEGPRTDFELNETAPTVLTSSSIINDISCWGAEDGRIDISWSATNDVYVSIDSGLTYNSATTFANSHRFQGLDSGNYFVTIRDENNCYIYYDQNRSHTLDLQTQSCLIVS